MNPPATAAGGPPRLVLVGPPGSGKTTVGRLAAQRLSMAFRDTDEDVAAAAGRSVADIFLTDGEAAFRVLERAAVATALAAHPGVLAVGGGVVLDPDTRARLRSAPLVVALAVGPAEAVRRVGLAQGRPLLAVNPRARLRQLLAERAPLYAEVAAVTVVTDGCRPEQVAARLAEEVDRCGS